MLTSFLLAASWLIPTALSAPASISARASTCDASTRIAAVRQVVKAHTTGSAADANAIPLAANAQIYTFVSQLPHVRVAFADASGPYRTVDGIYTYLQDNGAAAYRQTIEQDAVLFSNVQIISTTDYPSNLTTLIQYEYDFVSSCHLPSDCVSWQADSVTSKAGIPTYDYDLFTFNASCYIVYEHGFTTLPYLPGVN